MILAQHYDSVTRDLGKSFYQRVDAPASPGQKKSLQNLNPNRVDAKELAGEPIKEKLVRAPGNNQPIGGVKIIAQSGWFAARPSGTEDIYKIYAESFRNEDHLHEIQKDARATIGRVLEER